MFREDFLRMMAFIEANVISYRRVEDNTLLRRVSRAVGSQREWQVIAVGS